MKKITISVLMVFSTTVSADNPWEQFPDRKEGINIISAPLHERKQNNSTNETNKNALILIKQAKTASSETHKFIDNNDPKSTHLRLKKENISFAFVFPEIKKEDCKQIYGFAPGAAYVNDQWTGGVEIFQSNFDTACRLNVNAAQLNHSSVFVQEKFKTNKIHGKVTVENVGGNAQYGYIYTLSWC